MFAALRTTQAEPSLRPLVAAFAGVVIAATILGFLAFGQLTPSTSGIAPAAGAAPVLHDRGWATAPSAPVTAPVLHDRGLATAPSAPVTAPVINDRGWATAPSTPVTAPVLHDRGLATAPSAASGHSRFGGSGGPNGTRVAQ